MKAEVGSCLSKLLYLDPIYSQTLRYSSETERFQGQMILIEVLPVKNLQDLVLRQDTSVLIWLVHQHTACGTIYYCTL